MNDILNRLPPKPTLDDLDPMPFGQHEGTPMQDVPARYLHYLWVTGLRHSTTPVANYIRSRMSHLKHEHPDGIWS